MKYSILHVLIITSLVALPFADAFIRSSTSAKRPILEPLDHTMELARPIPQAQHVKGAKPTTNTIHIEKVRIEERKIVKYDLGLGKNKPVGNTKSEDSTLADSKDLDPTRFLVEHESVRSYPSPVSVNAESESKSNDRSKSKRKNLPTLQHKRHSEDVLRIQEPDCATSAKANRKNGNACRPLIVPINRPSIERNVPVAKLDVNTVWVEMMLHNELSKLVSK